MTDYVVVIAARMSSTRLPGKALAIYCPDGTTNLVQIVSRWRYHSRRSPTIIVATTDGAEDEAIELMCGALDVPFYRGSRDDVVSRVDNAIKQYAPDARFIARAMSDNPLVDVILADWRLDTLRETDAGGLWYGADHERITYAGTTDIWSRTAWDVIASESAGDEREHPGLYYWRHLSRFNVIQLPLPMREYLAPVRTELDTPEDLEMFRLLWKSWTLTESDMCIPTMWALTMLEKRPELAAINKRIEAKTQTRATWPKGIGFLCEQCQSRLGGIVAGDLEVRCARCGKPRRFYARKPSALRMLQKPSMGKY